MNKARLRSAVTKRSRAKLMEPRRPQETTLCMYEFASMKTTHHATEQHNAYHKHISVASTTHRPKKTLQSKSRRKIGRLRSAQPAARPARVLNALSTLGAIGSVLRSRPAKIFSIELLLLGRNLGKVGVALVPITAALKQPQR